MTYSRRTWANGNQWDATAANDFEGRIETEFGVKATEIAARASQTSLNTTNTNLSALDAREVSDVAALDARLDALEGITAVSSLPVSPVDGQQVYYIADGGNGVIWHLRYRSASGSTYKWEFVGGSSLQAEIVTTSSESITATGVYTSPTTPGPSVTLPLAGDYDIEIAFVAQHSAAGGLCAMSYDIGASAGSNADAAILYYSVANIGTARPHRVRRKTGMTAGVTLTCKYITNSGTLALMGTSGALGAHRFISARPVRVG